MLWHPFVPSFADVQVSPGTAKDIHSLINIFIHSLTHYTPSFPQTRDTEPMRCAIAPPPPLSQALQPIISESCTIILWFLH